MESREYINSKVSQLWSKLSLYQSYNDELFELKRQYRECEQKLLQIGSPKAIQYDKEVFSSGEDTSTLMNKVLSDMQRIERDISFAQAHMHEIETLCNLCDEEIQNVIKYKFFEYHSWDECEKNFFKTRRSLIRDIKHNLESFIHGVSE